MTEPELIQARRGMPAKTLTLPWCPSTNGYWRAFRGRQILSKKAREYRAEVLRLFAGDPYCTVGPFQAPSRLRVTMELYPPDRRVRDIDNACKALLDALTHAGVWADDSQIDDLRIIRRTVEKPGRVEVNIEEL